MTTINNQDDFLRALSENPEWRELVRAQILGDELLQLPARFDALSARLDSYIAELQEMNRRYDASIEELRESNRELREMVRRHDAAIAEIREEAQESNRRHDAAIAEIREENQEANRRHEAFVEEMREMARRHESTMQRMQEESEEANRRHEAAMHRMQEENEEANRRHEAAMQQMREDNEEANQRHQAFMEEMQQFRCEQQIINQDIRNLLDDLTRHVRILTDDVGKIKGHFAREVVVDDAAGLALDMGLEYVRTLTRDELREMAQRASGGSIPINQLRSFRRADLVIEATDGNDRHYITVEISFTADEREPTRALRHAGLLAEFTNCPAHAAIASVRNVQSVTDRINAGEIHWHPIDETDLEPD